MMDNRNKFDSLAEAEVFEYGFLLGAMLIVSILAEKQKFKISIARSPTCRFAASAGKAHGDGDFYVITSRSFYDFVVYYNHKSQKRHRI